MRRGYEIAYEENGEIVRGGIKAPLRRVREWIRANREQFPETEFFAVLASDDAITEEEFLNGYDADDDIIFELC